MKKTLSNPWFYLRLTLVAFMAMVSAMFYSRLPDPMPIHWNLFGEANNWASKTWGAWLLPAMTLGIVLLFPWLASMDPRRKNYEDFLPTWERLQTAIVTMMAYSYGLMLWITLHPEQQSEMGFWMMAGLGVFFIIIGNWMGKIRSNYFVGLRTPWTLEDPEVWQKSQRTAGWAFVGGGLVFLIQAWLEWKIEWVLGLTIGFMIAVPIVASYFFHVKNRSLNLKSNPSNSSIFLIQSRPSQLPKNRPLRSPLEPKAHK